MSIQHRSSFSPALACIMAAVLWGLFWYPLRLLEDMGLSGLWSALIIYCSAIIFIIPPFWSSKGAILHHKIEYLLISFFAGWTNLAFILAMLEGEVVRVLMLFYLSPIWSVVLAFLILHEKLAVSNIIVLIVALIGVTMMLWDARFFAIDLNLADIYAITSGIAFAVTNVMVRKLGIVPWSIKIGSACFGVIGLTLIGLLISNPILPNLSTTSASLAFFLGFPSVLIMTWMAQYGVTHLPIQRSSVIFLLEVFVGAVSADLLTDEVISLREYSGGTLIILAGLICLWSQKEAGPLS